MKFENRYYVTDEMLSEYVNKVLCKRLKRLGLIVTIAALLMLWLTWTNGDYILSAVFGSCLFISVFTILIAPPLTLRQLKESERRLHNNKKFETIVQFDKNITMTEGSFSLTVEYTQILKIYVLKYSYVLMLGRNNAIIIQPDHFTIGSFEEFKPYIESKCQL